MDLLVQYTCTSYCCYCYPFRETENAGGRVMLLHVHVVVHAVVFDRRYSTVTGLAFA